MVFLRFLLWAIPNPFARNGLGHIHAWLLHLDHPIKGFTPIGYFAIEYDRHVLGDGDIILKREPQSQ